MELDSHEAEARERFAKQFADLNRPAIETMTNLAKLTDKRRLGVAATVTDDARSNLEGLRRAMLGPSTRDYARLERLRAEMDEATRRRARVPIETRDALLEMNELLAAMRRDQAARDVAARWRDIGMLLLTGAIIVLMLVLR